MSNENEKILSEEELNEVTGGAARKKQPSTGKKQPEPVNQKKQPTPQQPLKKPEPQKNEQKKPAQPQKTGGKR